MNDKIVVLAHVPTKELTDGIIPTMIKRDIPVILLTDVPGQYNNFITQYHEQITLVACDVFNPITVINVLTDYQIKPLGVFSNSDHLQTSTSIVAEFYQLAGKNWHVTQLTKNKHLMRQHLLSAGLSNMWQYMANTMATLKQLLPKLSYPLIIKPCLGVASQGVKLIMDKKQLIDYCQKAWQESPCALLLEKYIEGTLYSIETLGNGYQIQVLGGFETRIGKPPYFIETGATWQNEFNHYITQQLLQQLDYLGVNFGACHTEFVFDRHTNSVEIIEANYRCAGDNRAFLLDKIYGENYFDCLIDLYLGEKSIHLQKSFNAGQIEFFVADKSGFITDHPCDYTKQLKNQLQCFNAIKQTHDHIQLSHSNKDYLGILQVIGKDQALIEQTINKEKEKLCWQIKE
ncbi:ATP-grasp domain-containing protein [Facilibium subflavum]|uniref:ATP-grasp domain-containing protein n=1 Tax=Facilibium subflavum TaxID=2219058 RepID=UPI000E65E59D|nr:ATP-grasp domain-containing protein [Facilibium subflavum]